MRRTMVVILGSGMLSLLGGCPSYLTLQSPRTVEPGQVELTAAVGTFITSGSDLFQPSFRGINRPWQVEGALRVGLVPNLDLGIHFRLADLGLSGGLKARFLNLEHFQLAVAGEVGTSLWAPIINSLSDTFLDERGIKVWLYWIDAAVIGGVPIGTDYLFFFGPKLKVTNFSLQNLTAFLGGTGSVGPVEVSSLQVQPGIVLGVDMTLMGVRRVLPEFNVHYDITTHAFIFQVGVSTTLGGHRKKRSAPPPTPGPKSPPPLPTPTDGFVPPPSLDPSAGTGH